MKGMELSGSYFMRAALPVIQANLPHIAGRCAAGLCAGGLDAGCGSEVYGYDDPISRDHNWGPRFFLFLSEEDYAAHSNSVREVLAARLPVAFEGFSILPTTSQSTHFHVTTPLRNARAALGVENPPQTDIEWFLIPETKLSEYSAGRMFYDPLDMVGTFKRRFRAYPKNVLLKRLAGALFMTHTAGNALRCARRREWSACRAYIDASIASAQRAALLISGRFPPHVKWRARAFRELPGVPEMWSARMDALALRIDPAALKDELSAVLAPLGDMLNASGLIQPQPVFVENDFLSFNCYGFSKAFEEEVRGELAGRPLAVALDQAGECCLPLSCEAVSAQWKAGRPGIAREF